MRLKANRLLALASVAFMSIFTMLVTPTIANAAEIQPPVSNGGVTCHHYTSATTWPTTYWNCDDSAYGGTTTANQAKVVTTAANALQTSVKSVLQAQTIDVYVFKNAADYGAFFGVSAPPAYAMSAALGTSKAAAFSYATQNGALQDLRAKLTPSMHQGLGRLYDNISGNPSANDSAFVAAIQYDKDEMDLYSSSTVWGATIAAQYPGLKPSQILNAAYGGTNQDYFAFKFQQNANGTSDTVIPLRNVMSSLTYTPTTNGVMKKNVYLVAGLPALTVTNGVICALWSTGWPDYPTQYYNCAHPFNPNSVEGDVKTEAHTLSANIRNQLGGINLYAMRKATDYAAFFSETFPNGTVNVFGAGKNNHAAAFEYVDNGVTGLQYVGTLMGGTIIHEIGHRLDQIWGDPSQKTTPPISTFNVKLNLDIAAFNTIPGGQTWAQACFNKIDQYLSPADQRCSSFASGTPLWTVLGATVPGKPKYYTTTPLEVFAYGFAYGHGNALSPITNFQAQLTNVNTYMATVHQTGTP